MKLKRILCMLMATVLVSVTAVCCRGSSVNTDTESEGAE